MEPNEAIVARSFSDGTFEPLEDHARAVAELAEKFASAFDAGGLGLVAGWLHDLGKADPDWQGYIRRKAAAEREGGQEAADRIPKVPHSAEGARCAHALAPSFLGRALAFIIAGHHAGLANGRVSSGGLTPLDERIAGAKAMRPSIEIEALIGDAAIPERIKASRFPAFSCAFFIRMLFSCLVDADRLASEAAEAAATGGAIDRGWSGEIRELRELLDHRLAAFSAPVNEVGRLRADVLAACRAAETQPPGLFSLSVPTGGGKTLSSLAFALNHAERHGLRRVVYVAPFTSIVEQTAKVFREALIREGTPPDDDPVLEHHSAFEAHRRSEDVAEADLRVAHAAENWDRPIVVTTAVQFFESLFANSPGRCRKLHRLARSVVILDEAQSLPLPVFRPCLAALDELARVYGATVVLCTATQPAVRTEDGLRAPEALQGVREIMPEPDRQAARVRRVRAEIAPEPLSDAALVEAMLAEKSALCIVNNRRHARELFGMLKEAAPDGAPLWHLSTAMTAAHRSAALDEIRAGLAAERPVRAVSTSLIEAGVDISFASVWRAVAGADSVAQAAGRCNRGGELGELGGRLTIFTPAEAEGRQPPRELLQFALAAQAVWTKGGDPLSPEAVRAYFTELLRLRVGADGRELDCLRFGDDGFEGVMALLHEGREIAGRRLSRPASYRFADLGAGFRLIKDAQAPVIIGADASAYGAPEELLDRLRHLQGLQGVARQLQRFTVQIPRRALADLVAAGAAQPVREREFPGQFFALANAALYDRDCGLIWGDPHGLRAESLIIS